MDLDSKQNTYLFILVLLLDHLVNLAEVLVDPGAGNGSHVAFLDLLSDLFAHFEANFELLVKSAMESALL